MVQVAPYVLMIIALVVVPLLKKLIPLLKEQAAKTDSPVDDMLVGTFEVVLNALEGGGIFVPKK